MERGGGMPETAGQGWASGCGGFRELGFRVWGSGSGLQQ
jgi:hypothetical protein